MNPNYSLHPRTPITRDMFPVGKPVVLDSFVDTNCGWEFDAPLHFFAPIHLYYEVGSNHEDTVSEKIYELLVDLEDREVEQSLSTWPYLSNYYEQMVAKITKGKAPKRLSLYRTTVTVRHWGEDGYDVFTEELP